ncbi:SIR2 family protein [Peristeroidobacter soli]|uniref:SIR2 family protein n=1 Tax=Peristeroidobacter soli TaxID=2497877 RepID=UPI00101C89B6|nr:SIR2 family protein [Peristeroidobacter soli]
MAIVSLESFIEDFSSELRDRNAAIFAGAGLSVDAGFVNWKGLLRPLAVELGLDVDREHDLVRIAQYHVNHHDSNRHDLTQAVLNKFAEKEARVTENHRILARLPIQTFWTTNYDSCIEQALRAAGKNPDVKHDPKQLPHTLHGRGAIVYKMHGDHSHPSETILCKEDYERYPVSHGDFLTALAGDLLSKTFLFVGFSFSDPNLDYVLGRLYTRHGRNQRKHYCFVKKESAEAADAPGDLEYRVAKQELFIRDLGRYNIRAVVIDAYEDITRVLSLVENRYKSKTVFVSGAAHEYGALSERDALGFVHSLGKTLIDRDFRIVTGLGLGVGSTIVDGALQQIYQVQRRSLTDQLLIRPFPQSVTGKMLWTSYRHDMLAYAGLAVFMFGNKLEGGATPSVVDSNGMIEEFEIACAKGTRVLPLGFTGYVARQLYEKVFASFGAYYPTATTAFKQQFRHLGDTTRTLTEQLTTTVDALVELQKM